jgi:ubiquinone/menaquinone biosynthesis C-methylase UbiE
VLASGDRLPMGDGTVTTLVTSEVIEHVTNAGEHLAEAVRVLEPGGILVVGTPDYGRWLWWAIEWVYGKVLPGAYAHEHVTHFTRDGLAQALRALDLEILDCRYVGFCEMIFKARKPLT